MFISLAFFALSLLAGEFAVVTPFFITALILIEKKNINRKYIFSICCYIIPVIIYTLIRIFIIPAPLNQDYSLNIGLKTIENVIWYIAWIMNIPETLKEHFSISNFSVTNDFLIGFKKFMPYAVFSYSVFFLAFVLSILKTKIPLRKFTIFATMFIVGLLPVILFSNHSYGYYLTFSSLPFFIFLAHIFRNLFVIKLKSVVVILVLFWMISSSITLKYLSKNHWVSAEQAISHRVSAYLLKKSSDGSNYKEVIIFPSNNQLRQSLMNQNAAHVIFQNKNIKTTYATEAPIFWGEESLILNLNEKY